MCIDITRIRLIVHVDEPRSTRDYRKGSGQAGKDGLGRASARGWDGSADRSISSLELVRFVITHLNMLSYL